MQESKKKDGRGKKSGYPVPDEQADAAEILMVSRPRVSDVANMKVSKFTIDTLVNMLSRAGKPVRLAIG